MKDTQTTLSIIAFTLTGFAISCGMFGGSDANGTSTGNKTEKGLAAAPVCQLLAHPEFESKFPYGGKSCSGSTTFGAKDMRAGPSDTDKRASFSYAVVGENDMTQKIMLNMSKRPDGGAFFLAEANAVAKMINGAPLPKEIEDAITAPLPASGGLAGYGDRFTTNSQVGNAKVELIRTNSDSGFSLTFQF